MTNNNEDKILIMKNMDISVIIVNYNTGYLTIQCIKSIVNNSFDINYEIIVVDNASTDNSVNEIKQLFPIVKIIRNKQNVGFGIANNIGALEAKGKYLFLLNSDTILLNNALKIFFDFYENQISLINIGVIGGILLDKNGKENESCAHFPNALSIILKAFKCNIIDKTYIRNIMKRLDKQSYTSVDYVCGADMFMSKYLFSQVCGFSKDFFMYYEESDLQKRISLMGKHNYILSSVKIIHLVGSSQKKILKNRKRIIIGESMLTYMKKHNILLYYNTFKYIYIFIEIIKSFRKQYSYKDNHDYIKKLFRK